MKKDVKPEIAEGSGWDVQRDDVPQTCLPMWEQKSLRDQTRQGRDRKTPARRGFVIFTEVERSMSQNDIINKDEWKIDPSPPEVKGAKQLAQNRTDTQETHDVYVQAVDHHSTGPWPKAAQPGSSNLNKGEGDVIPRPVAFSTSLAPSPCRCLRNPKLQEDEETNAPLPEPKSLAETD